MKRADVKAGVLYAVKVGNPVMVLLAVPWAQEQISRGETTYRPARVGEKSSRTGRGWGGYDRTDIGLPAAERVPLMMPNPEYVGEAEEESIRAELMAWANGDYAKFHEAVRKNPRLRPEIPDPLRWEWKPTILEPRDALAPLDEHEAARRAEQERQNAEREAQRDELDDRRARLTAIADVLPLDDVQRRDLLTRTTPYRRGHYAEVSLEWLEEVAGRLRQGSGCVEVH